MRNLHKRPALESLYNPISEQAILKRKIHLKRQAITLIKNEIIELQLRLALIKLNDCFERQVKDYDPLLSQKIDCLTFLLEN